MKQISSSLTSFYKRTVPIFWFGTLALGATSVAFVKSGGVTPMLFLGPCALAVIGYLSIRTLYGKLADKVCDCGDYLVITKRGEEERIPLSEILEVRKSWITNPPRITLRLSCPRALGTQIAFIPVVPLTFNPFAKNKVVEDLILRAQKASRASAPGSS
jgi:hypothetical protein